MEKLPKTVADFERLIIAQIEFEICSLYQGTDLRFIEKLYTDEVTRPEMRRFDDGYRILLSKDAGANFAREVFELAHEFVHLIAPIAPKEVNYFEEGLAVKFQLEFVKNLDWWNGDRTMTYYEFSLSKLPEDQKYHEAYLDILEIEKLSGKPINAICKELFENNHISNFGMLKPVILCTVTGIPAESEVLERICRKFY